MITYNIATPYTAIYLILKREGKIAFLLRQNTDWMSNHYGLIQGKVEKTESFLAAAVREAKEEAGIDVSYHHLHHLLTGYRKTPQSVWVDVIFHVAKWEGEPYNAEPHKHGALT